MITVDKLTKIYRTPEMQTGVLQRIFARTYVQHTAINRLSFDIGADELVGFIGPNGAGKTTTLKILSGILYPTSGFAQVLGFTPFDKKPEFLKQISFVMGQKNQLVWELPPTDSFRLNKEIYEVDDRTFRETVGELVERLDCKDFINRPVKTLSLGQRMKAELINSLLYRPKILFLDEPTIGLDIFAQTSIIDFIKQYQSDYHATIILTSHYMQDVERLAKRVIMIDRGSIVYDGDFRNLVQTYSQEKTVYVTLQKPLPKNFELPEYHVSYQYPVLKLKIKKQDINHVLSLILKHAEFSDITVENERIEEIVKKKFGDTHTNR